MRSIATVLAVAFAVVTLAFVRAPQAAPPENANPAYEAWFESLQQPNGKFSCCSIADCHIAQARAAGPEYEVKIDEAWLPVPATQVVSHVANPTGQAVVCYRRVRDPDGSGDVNRSGIKIFCFVRPPET